jgi:type I restriction enzyme, S subunit
MMPKLRFPHISGSWQVTNVGVLVKEGVLARPMDGNHGNIHPKASDFVSEGIPFIMANNITNGKLDLENSAKIRKVQSDKLQKGFSYPGDVLISHKASIGLTAIVPETDTEYIMLTPQVTYYRVLDDSRMNNHYLRYFFETPLFQDELRVKSGGGTRSYIGITEQSKLSVKLPPIKEQEKIAEFLSAVDEKVVALEKKVELMQKYKKGVMQQIFSQKIRFKDDSGNPYPTWQEKILEDVFSCTKGSGLSKDKVNKNGVNKCVLYGELYTTYPEIIKHVINRTNSNDGTRSRTGDLLVPCSTTTSGVDLSNVTEIQEKDVLLGGDISILRFKQSGYPRFYAYYLSHFKRNEIARFAQGSTIVHLYYSHFKKMLIDIPVTGEQQKIAEFLTVIDEKINLEKNKLEQAKLFKKSLLQRMFV